MLTIPKGSKLGIATTYKGDTAGALKVMLDAGIYPTVMQGVDNAGVAIAAKKANRAILTITRETGRDKPGVQGVESWSDVHMRATASYDIGWLESKLNNEERDAADRVTLYNEPAPSAKDGSHFFPQGYKALGDYFHYVLEAAKAAGFKLALPGFPFGTPEAIDDTAFISAVLEDFVAYDAWLTFHEGVTPGSNDPLAFGPIPGGPDVASAGPTAWRYRYFAAIARDLGKTMPNVVITEWYGGGTLARGHEGDILSRIAKYDTEVRQDDYVLGFLPFTVGGKGGGWDSQDYGFIYPAAAGYAASIKDQPNHVTQVILPPPPAPVLPAPGMVGLHGRADGRLKPFDLAAVKEARVQSVKLLSSAAPEDVAALKAIDPDIFVVVRLYDDFEGRTITPGQFVSWHAPDVAAFMAQGVYDFEIHNEPNLELEGLSTSWEDGQGFASWYTAVYHALKVQFPQARFGLPGLSPGGDIEGVRQDAIAFADAMGVVPYDWVGQHIYWQSEEEMNGAWAQLARTRQLYPLADIYITEFSNVAPGVDKASKGAQYVRFYNQMAAQPGVRCAFSFCSSASNPGFAEEAWVSEDGALSPIPGLIGSRKDTMNNQYKVTAGLLNVREFPWVGSVQPARVGQLKQGDIVTQYGAAFILPGMVAGWVCISPNANMWVSGVYITHI